MDLPDRDSDRCPSSSRPARRVNVMLRHLGPRGSSNSLEMVATNSQLVSIAPFLLMGAIQWYQSRQQEKPEVRPLSEMEVLAEEHGFDADRLVLLKEWVNKLLAAQQLPGAVIAVCRKGSLIFHEAYGEAGYSNDSIMTIRSMISPIIAATFLSLVDEGLASIDDDVTKYLPYFAKFRVHRSGSTADTFVTDALVHNITVRHLLTDTWGFPSVLPTRSSSADICALDALAALENPIIGNDVDFEKLTDIPLLGQPGSQYRVSLAPCVIGHIISKITGKPLRDVVFERILHPLGMDDTDWYVPRDKQNRVTGLHQARPYLTNRLWGNRLTGESAGHSSWLGWVAKSWPQQVPEQLPSEISQSSEVFSTALDQLCFHTMLLNDGLSASGARVLSQESVRQMTMDQIPFLGGAGLGDAQFNTHMRDKPGSVGQAAPQFGAGSTGQGVGLGLHVVRRPVTSRLAGSKGTFSSWGCNGTECWTDPSLELSIFVGTQLFPSWALPETRQEVAGHVYGSLVSTSAAKHFAGIADANGGGMMGNVMNMVMMASMFGGMGSMGGGGAIAGAGGEGAAGAGEGGVAGGQDAGGGGIGPV